MFDNRSILMVNNSLSNGGSERVMSMLANEFVLRDYEVDMLIQNADASETYQIDGRINKIKYVAGEYRGIRYTYAWLRFIRKQLKKKRYRAVISFMMENNVVTIAAGIGLGQKIIVSERCNPNNVSDYGRIFKIGEQLLYPLARTVVFQTDEVKHFYKKSIRKKGTVIPNPVNPDMPGQCPMEMRKKMIVSAGRLSKQKNYPMLLRAFKVFHDVCPEYVLKIYGKGELLDELKSLCGILKIEDNVYFMGYVDDVDKHIREAAMFVMSSDYEGISNTMIEALAMGVPTICTDCPVGGARLMIEDGVNGLLIPVGDADAMADAMLKIAKNPDYAQGLGQEALKVNGKYCIKSIADKWESILII